jgi:hypothetical protein
LIKIKSFLISQHKLNLHKRQIVSVSQFNRQYSCCLLEINLVWIYKQVKMTFMTIIFQYSLQTCQYWIILTLLHYPQMALQAQIDYQALLQFPLFLILIIAQFLQTINPTKIKILNNYWCELVWTMKMSRNKLISHIF